MSADVVQRIVVAQYGLGDELRNSMQKYVAELLEQVYQPEYLPPMFRSHPVARGWTPRIEVGVPAQKHLYVKFAELTMGSRVPIILREPARLLVRGHNPGTIAVIIEAYSALIRAVYGEVTHVQAKTHVTAKPGRYAAYFTVPKDNERAELLRRILPLRNRKISVHIKQKSE